jgi:hypothetical protein
MLKCFLNKYSKYISSLVQYSSLLIVVLICNSSAKSQEEEASKQSFTKLPHRSEIFFYLEKDDRNCAMLVCKDWCYEYDSLSDLKSKAQSTVTFMHNLSCFSIWRMSESTREFFMKHGNLFDSSGNVPQNVTVAGDFAIDVKSWIGDAHSGNVLLGQHMKTGKFLAFKAISAIDESENEIEQLSVCNRYYGVANLSSVDSLSGLIKITKYFALDLVDGVTFHDFRQRMLPHINKHTQYLITYNFVKEIGYFDSLNLQQIDQNLKNFMVDARDWSVKVVDFDNVTPFSGPINGKWDAHGKLWFIFNSKLNGHTFGSFRNLLEVISSSDDMVDATTCTKCLPF